MKYRITKDKNGYHAYVLEEINLNGFYYLQSVWTEIENKFFGQKYYDTEEEAIEACEHYQDKKKNHGDSPMKIHKERQYIVTVNPEYVRHLYEQVSAFCLLTVKNPEASVKGISDGISDFITQNELKNFEVVSNIYNSEWKLYGEYL